MRDEERDSHVHRASINIAALKHLTFAKWITDKSISNQFYLHGYWSNRTPSKLESLLPKAAVQLILLITRGLIMIMVIIMVIRVITVIV